jgi:hypothetical protein
MPSTTWILQNRKELFSILENIPGAKHCHGECSFAVSFELKDGSFLEIGQTDEDVSEPHLMWFKHWTKS